MKKQWKRFAAIAGVVALVMCQSSYIPANAEEPLNQDAQEKTVDEENTFGEPDNNAAGEEKKADAEAGTGTTDDKVSAEEGTDLTADSESREGNDVGETKPVAANVQPETKPVAASVQAETEPETELTEINMSLEWTEEGGGTIVCPFDVERLDAYLYHESDLKNYVGVPIFNEKPHNQGDTVTLDLFYLIEMHGKEGNYYFEVEAVDKNGKVFSSERSGAFEYTKPKTQLPKLTPTVSKDGVVSYELPDRADYEIGKDYEIELEIHEDDRIFGYVLSPEVGEDMSNLDLAGAGLVKEGHYYLIRVRLVSMNIKKWLSGEFSGCTLDLRTEKTDSSKKKSSSKDEPSDSSFPSYREGGSSFENNEPIIEVWKPITPDEIKRYAAYGREKVSFTTDAASGYSVSIYNAMQGKQCYDSFESVLGDYTIGRTYNIYPSGKAVYKTDSKARITLNIPTVMQKDGREFRMICVTEKGRPVVLTDLDSNPNTITFETDTYYAFALVYKDTK